MGFFFDTFGFEEDGETQERLLKMATFRQSPSKHASYYRERCDFRLADGRILTAGIFSIPSVAELRAQAGAFAREFASSNTTSSSGSSSSSNNQSVPPTFAIAVRNMVGESRSLHTTTTATTSATAYTTVTQSAGDVPQRQQQGQQQGQQQRQQQRQQQGQPAVVVQAASQFNCLEFPTPYTIPEDGISDYIRDRTQGPACAIACAAGTAYRNYLVLASLSPNRSMLTTTPLQRGQDAQLCQLNGLSDVEDYLERETGLGVTPWTVTNGYIESSKELLGPLNEHLSGPGGGALREELIARLRIGVQEDTTVTDDPTFRTKVTQAYASAVSIGYSKVSADNWEALGRIVLDAAYEATLLTAVLQSKPGAPPPIVLLTKLGGGVFQNRVEWITAAMERAIRTVGTYGVALDVRIVHFGSIEDEYRSLET